MVNNTYFKGPVKTKQIFAVSVLFFFVYLDTHTQKGHAQTHFKKYSLCAFACE